MKPLGTSRSMVLLQSPKMINPGLAILAGNFRIPKLVLDVLEVVCEDLACESFDVFDQNRFRPKLPYDLHDLREQRADR